MPLIPAKFKAAALAAIAATSGLAATPALADHHPADYHKEMSAKAAPDIVETAMSTGVHDTLVAAVKAAGLVETLQSAGPFTVFAPTDTGFAKLPEGTVPTLLKPANKSALAGVLTYHAVAGEVSARDLVGLINQHGGSATIKTIAGGTLTARLSGDTVVITDAQGRTAAVTQTDVKTANGIIHVTDGVFLPA